MTGYHYVRPHARSNGSHVRGHVQRNPSRASAGAGLPIVLLILLILLFLFLASSHGAAAHRPTVHSVKTPSHSQETVRTTRNDRAPVTQRG